MQQSSNYCAAHDLVYTSWCPHCSSSNYEIIFKVASEEIIKFLQEKTTPQLPLDDIIPRCMTLPAVKTFVTREDKQQQAMNEARVRAVISAWIKAYIALPDEVSRQLYGFKITKIVER